MAIKVKIPRVKGFRGGLKSPILRAGVAAFLIIVRFKVDVALVAVAAIVGGIAYAAVLALAGRG